VAELGAEAGRIEETLRTYVATHYGGGMAAHELDPDADLLGGGIVDSVGVMELTGYLTEAFGVAVEDEDIVPDNFQSVRSMTRFVVDKQGLTLEGEDDYAAAVRALVVGAVPTGAVVLVVSRGDDALLELDGRTGRHFPRGEDGAHAGYNPADGADAIAQLEAQRSQGATHLVFPATELWWLDEYAGLHDHLESLDGVVGRDEAGAVYSLGRS
jgi:acyl carrier protein